MHISALTTVFFAALATAHSHYGHAQRFHHRRALNESIAATSTSTSSAVDLTTLTVQITTVHTIFSCAQNVTSCGAAAATGAKTVTRVIDLTTTVCPAAEASAISSSVIANAPQNQAVVVTPTASVAPVNSAPAAVEVADSVLTYTVGTGSSKTVVTTTIKHTKTATVYATKYVTPDAKVVDTNNNAGIGGPTGPELTTTIRSTQTSTRTITVKPVSSGTGTNAFVGVPQGEGQGSGASGCAPPVTVTVALSTVTVTYTPPAPSTVAPSANAKAVGNGPVATSVPSAAAITPVAQGAIPETTQTAAPSTTVEEAPAVVTQSIVVIPVPYGNSTTTSTTRASSGFLRLARRSGTGSSIAPAPTGGRLY